MKLNLAVAPCSWGIEDPENPDNPPWQTVLSEAAEAGFTAIELGPYGYLPTDSGLLKESLAEKQLRIVAGTIYDDLTANADTAYLLEKTRNICSLLSEVNNSDENGFLVIIDAVKESRNNTAGHPGLAERLNAAEWKAMMNNIEEISVTASSEFGVRPVVHPHAGGFIEFRDETERFLNDLSQDSAGLCLDTGHLYYAGDDPADSLADFSARLEYVHFKDINRAVYTAALKERLGFFDACKLGVMCSIGRGAVDYGTVFSILDELSYEGWVTIEQERDPRDFGGALEDLKTSYNYLINSLKFSE